MRVYIYIYIYTCVYVYTYVYTHTSGGWGLSVQLPGGPFREAIQSTWSGPTWPRILISIIIITIITLTTIIMINGSSTIVVVIVVVVVVVVIIVPNGLVYDLWVKHIFSNNMYTSIGKRNQYVWQVPLPKTIYKITTNIKHQSQQTSGNNNENTLLTKGSAESDSIFQMKGPYEKQKHP